jgi:hypothetical protein
MEKLCVNEEKYLVGLTLGGYPVKEDVKILNFLMV